MAGNCVLRQSVSTLISPTQMAVVNTAQPVLSGHSKEQYRSSPYRGQKYCRLLQWKHSAILSISIKLRFPSKALVLSILKWPLKTGFTVHSPRQKRSCLFPVLKYHHVTTAEVIQLFTCSTVHGISTAHN